MVGVCDSTVGKFVDSLLGLDVGSCVASVGEPVLTVGLIVGLFVSETGRVVGSIVGLSVRTKVGNIVGLFVFAVGTPVG